MSIDNEIDRERRAYADAAETAKRFVDAGASLARLGDGNCGYLLSLVKDELRLRGLYRENTPRAPRRKTLPNHVRTRVFERDQYRCKGCETHLDLTVDHIVPVALGGGDDFHNLQTLCRTCNAKKGASA